MEKSEWIATRVRYVKHTSGYSSVIDRVRRDGLDIRGAFKSGFARRVLTPGDPKPVGNLHNCEATLDPTDSVTASQSIRVIGRSKGKAVLRKIAQFGYRLLKPIVRPVAFRLRRYLIEDFRHEINQEIQRVSTAATQELHLIRDALQEEIQRTSAGTIQELQLVREVCLGGAYGKPTVQLQDFQSRYADLLLRLDRIEQFSVAAARRFAIGCGDEAVLVRTEVGYVFCSEIGPEFACGPD